MTQPVAWITGASSGIGRSLAEEYHDQGWQVILSARSADKLQALSDKLGKRSTVLVADVTDRAQVADAVSTIDHHFGRLDLLINNAGISQRSTIIDTEIHVFRRLMEVNYLGAVIVTKMALPLLIKSKGHIAVISSVAGKIGAPKRSGYSASKHALHGFFDCLRSEHADDAVGVTMVCPGYVSTDVDLNALGSDGQPIQQKDADNRNGLSPSVVARRIAKAVSNRKAEVYIGGFEIIAIYLQRYIPALLRRILKKQARQS